MMYPFSQLKSTDSIMELFKNPKDGISRQVSFSVHGRKEVFTLTIHNCATHTTDEPDWRIQVTQGRQSFGNLLPHYTIATSIEFIHRNIADFIQIQEDVAEAELHRGMRANVNAFLSMTRRRRHSMLRGMRG